MYAWMHTHRSQPIHTITMQSIVQKIRVRFKLSSRARKFGAKIRAIWREFYGQTISARANLQALDFVFRQFTRVHFRLLRYLYSCRFLHAAETSSALCLPFLLLLAVIMCVYVCLYACLCMHVYMHISAASCLLRRAARSAGLFVPRRCNHVCIRMFMCVYMYARIHA